MTRYSNIHRQQLFHWIGSHIDQRHPSTPLTDEDREEYVQCLEGALVGGLWLKRPRDPDQLGDGSLVKVSRPIVCFTEWSLGQSLPHTTRYGRLGLGFPKRFVLDRGGQPVTYVRDHRRNDPYCAALKLLAQYFRGLSADRGLSAARLERLRQHFDYLTHFAKRIRRPVVKSARPARKPRATTAARRPAREADPFERLYGGKLHYLEEREWRIVYDEDLGEYFTPGPASGLPEYYLPFRPGAELFTVALPDNRTVHIASSRRLTARLFPAQAPHVTLLSLEDVGTF